MINDTGAREQFSSGAVRDMNDGKGRCDLLPLSVICSILDYQSTKNKYDVQNGELVTLEMKTTEVLKNIEEFQKSGDVNYLYEVVEAFINQAYGGDKIKAVLELAVHYEEGAKKYAEWNWTKGIPLWSFISSAVRHYLKVKAGWTDESHERAFLWNIVGAIWTVQNRPDLVKILDYSNGYVPLNSNNQSVVPEPVVHTTLIESLNSAGE